MKKGDIILYSFAFSITEAKIIEVYENDYIKVKHKGLFLPIKDIIPTSRVIGVKKS